jgi:DNA replication initiation complex subunit (GINS family)
MIGMANAINEKIILTYETLYEILRKEKSKDELQRLDAGFLANALAYLKEKQLLYDEAMRKTDIFSVADRDKLSTQLYNIRKLMRELYEKREKKILDMAVNRSKTNSAIIDTSNLLSHEKELFGSFVEVLDRFRKGVLHSMLELKEPMQISATSAVCQQAASGEQTAQLLQTTQTADEEENEKKTRFVKFSQPIEQFVGSELELYGPFESEAKAYLPKDIADILINDHRAVEIEDE